MKFRKKPVVIEAIQWTGQQLAVFLHYGFVFNGYCNPDGSLSIVTLEGVMRCEVGDWIIRGVKGEFYPCKPDIFEQTYESMEDHHDCWPESNTDKATQIIPIKESSTGA